ncbi:hypothetical protein ACN95_11150 [Gordonia sihwensis]|uniref:hypothetical protein n=1 Tax=Gordonia TaxID=2053 RepID=UPI0007863226|nr:MULTISPECIES: hypothetical protein [Gordonia]MBY4570571.1 hypothetical protein [Gordonia sihwensis]WFN91293.1 hypothetical protein P5P27_10860 [Gordonia sihwensis]
MPWIAAGTVVLGVIVAVIVLVVVDSGPSRVTASSVVAECDSSSSTLTLAEDGKTIEFTYHPDRSTSQAVYDCLLEQTKAPSSVDARVLGTRAIDGTQQADWEGWEMFWNYHPDSGASITLSEH